MPKVEKSSTRATPKGMMSKTDIAQKLIALGIYAGSEHLLPDGVEGQDPTEPAAVNEAPAVDGAKKTTRKRAPKRRASPKRKGTPKQRGLVPTSGEPVVPEGYLPIVRHDTLATSRSHDPSLARPSMPLFAPSPSGTQRSPVVQGELVSPREDPLCNPDLMEDVDVMGGAWLLMLLSRDGNPTGLPPQPRMTRQGQ